ncbi:MAG: GGDEF domain-containing protein [Deltaproteobacteria bacterium]|nr:GGDEF domain-containing protein [Deltaproteobacteria bacterium]MBW2172896.1 GGDEF domain-containing protein [Deltaproteobacteria bacterium]
MPLWVKRIVYPLIIPTVLIILSALVIWKWPDLVHKINQVKELRALLIILPVLPYAVCALGIIMGWRYGNAGMMLASLALAISYLVVDGFTPASVVAGGIGPSLPKTVAFLLPLNLAVFTLLTKRRIFTSTGVLFVFLVMLQISAVVVLCSPPHDPGARLLSRMGSLSPEGTKKLTEFLTGLRSFFHDSSLFGHARVSTSSIIAYSLALVFVLIRFLLRRDVILGGFLGALVATFIGIAADSLEPSMMIFFSAAGFMLIITSIEASFSLAYMDDLTGLPGRRSLNQSLGELGKKYAIAMIDIDLFKKFNDRYGHQTGDQVLKMVASKLRNMSGGSKAFRYGGEEFTAIFPGKDAEEAVPYLQKYRRMIENTPFVVRSKTRRKSTSKSRGKTKLSGLRRAKVTVSIGVAAPDKDLANPERVLKAADKALYKAKKAGRNRVKI